MIKVFTTNAAGLKPKIESLKAQLNKLEIPIFTIQETHYSTKGKIKVCDFVVFEAIRKNKKKGGTAVGVHKSLKPVLIEEYSEEFELIVVEIKVQNEDIRVISRYGQQESWPEAERQQFFLTLESEIEKANLAGREVIVSMDANSKLGKKYIPKDKHKMCENGKVLS